MKIKYFSTLVAASIVSFTALVGPTPYTTAQANPCAAEAVNPCAANPCAANPCAANPCAADPCAAAADPCAADPCAANPCAADPCAADPCAAAADPCAAAAAADIPTVFSDPQANDNLAIRGYDPVAYFTVGAPVEGSSDYEYEWNGATWRFSSAAHKDMFASNPEAYAPQYGGYCAKALSEGNLASTVPEAWEVVDGKLYLNYSLDVQKQWQEDVPGNITKADAQWPSILDTSDVVFYDTVGAVYF
ncbi:yhs domain-containing protein [Leptolyngbya sp. Heron Island J]|uniref:YHS domain-containing (seleno)protein n=1 Tax=Leptolyngbya sp. Heron Island J TaxID=1385935 RepID=UPI0003B977BE|nr:YHS domain-containing (seleno)protein [Leptolyngbya sp. Heron Island J]ESA36463.1 yhs domain-containing protein [Leptolyngbya sp. Heron Island J]